MQKKRLKIIPDRIFHKLWSYTEEYENCDEYINSITSNSRIFNYKSHYLDYYEYISMLKCIYNLRQLKLKDISDRTFKKKSEFSHIFCIPIRTIEAWYSDINPMPSYILLMMIKHFHLLNLGKYIRLESELEHEATKPAIYNKKSVPNVLNEQELKASDTEYRKKSDYELYLESEEYDTYLDRLIENIKNNRRKE